MCRRRLLPLMGLRFCAGCTAFNAVTDTIAELSGEAKDTWIAVIGCGGLGHLGIQYLKAYGYKVVGK
jgi:alcohol dehydrogenase, propanol-preferring